MPIFLRRPISTEGQRRGIFHEAVGSADIADGSLTGDDIADGSVSDSKISYSTKTGYLSIPAAALDPAYDGIDYIHTWSRAYDKSYLSGLGVFIAPVHLPQGAQVTKLRFYAKDNRSAPYVSARLIRIGHTNPTQFSMAHVSTAGMTNSTTYRTLVDNVHSPAGTIDNNNFSHVVEVGMGEKSNELRVGNIVIEYTYTTPGG